MMNSLVSDYERGPSFICCDFLTGFEYKLRISFWMAMALSVASKFKERLCIVFDERLSTLG